MNAIPTLALLLTLFPIVAAAQEPAHRCTPGWMHGDGVPGCTITRVPLVGSRVRFDGQISVKLGDRPTRWANIRNGYLEANPAVPFKGNLIYLEGIADSMLNHELLFKRATDEGYRVIGFDLEGYGGFGNVPADPSDRNATVFESLNESIRKELGLPKQAASPGSQDDTRLLDTLTIAEQIFYRNAVRKSGAPRVFMGWSIGGITGYAAAARLHPFRPDAVILLAPSIVPRPLHTGEGVFHLPPAAFSERALVASKFDNQCRSPFVDPIRPITPASSPAFSISLLQLAGKCRDTAISPEIKGLVLMSGPEDHFVDVEKTAKVFAEKAPHFEYVTYPGTKHMVDAESCDVREDMANRVSAFLKAL